MVRACAPDSAAGLVHNLDSDELTSEVVPPAVDLRRPTPPDALLDAVSHNHAADALVGLDHRAQIDERTASEARRCSARMRGPL